MSVRPATPADVRAMATVHVVSWQATYRGIMDNEYLDNLDIDQRAKGWERMLADPTIMARVAGDPISGIAVFHADRGDSGGGEIGILYVLPEMLGTGMGAELLTAAEAALRDEGYQSAVLWVATKNGRARRFYEKHGWLADGAERSEAIGSSEVHEVRYTKRLV